MWKCKWVYKALKKGGFTNWGHRLYDKLHPTIPENSIAALREGLKHQDHKNFKYFEFDVVESRDGFLYVFHDATKRKTIKRLCPTADKRLQKKSIYELTAGQIETLELMHTTEKVPSVAELYSEFARHKITVPIRVEVKKLMTTKAIKDLVEMTAAFRSSTRLDVNFMMFKKKFNKMSKENREYFMGKLLRNDFKLIWI